MSSPNLSDCASGVPQQLYDTELPCYQFGLTVAALASSATSAVTNGSTSVTFSSAQTLNAGAALYFASHPGVPYYLAAAVTASTSATLTANYAGASAAATPTTTVAALAATVSLTKGSAAITFSANQTFAVGTLFQFSAQPGVWYALSAAISAATAATLSTPYVGPTAGAANVIAQAALTGTVTLTNGSASITFSVAQTLAAGTALMFSAQPGVIYQLAASITAATAATLTSVYTGTASSTGGTVAGNNDYVPSKPTAANLAAGGQARAVLCTSPGTLICDAYGLQGQGSGTIGQPIPMTAGQQVQLAVTKIHSQSTGAYVALQ
jgi:hypothetical protein